MTWAGLHSQYSYLRVLSPERYCMFPRMRREDRLRASLAHCSSCEWLLSLARPRVTECHRTRCSARFDAHWYCAIGWRPRQAAIKACVVYTVMALYVAKIGQEGHLNGLPDVALRLSLQTLSVVESHCVERRLKCSSFGIYNYKVRCGIRSIGLKPF